MIGLGLVAQTSVCASLTLDALDSLARTDIESCFRVSYFEFRFSIFE